MENTHLFFSYAHADADQMLPIRDRMELVTEHTIWIDQIGLERGIEWENAIQRAITSSYGVIFAITRAFVDPARTFIHSKEIPWAFDHFKDKQGPCLFVIRFDDEEVPDLLKTPYVTEQIDARDGDMQRVYDHLKRTLPEPKGSSIPFVMGWPRLKNFKGRDATLVDLHKKLIGEGRVGVKTAGLHGMGGIGKTQLAVQYAHVYRFYYPGGVYWLNAAQDWRREINACADRLGLTPADASDSDREKQMVLAFERHINQDGGGALLVLDNVHDPAEITRREIAPKLTVADLCRGGGTRLLLTTRVQKLPGDFASVEVNVLQPPDARAVLLDAFEGRPDRANPDVSSLDAIAKALGYLPLPLGWMAAALRQKPTLQPAKLLESLKKGGVDAIIAQLKRNRVELGTPEHYEALVGAALAWQIEQLDDVNAVELLALTAAYGEAAVIPAARLKLLVEFDDDGLFDTFAEAMQRLKDYSLVEPLNDGAALRLHPLVMEYVRRELESLTRLRAAAPRLAAAYRDPAVIDAQTRERGFPAALEDLLATQRTLSGERSPELDGIARILTLCEPQLHTPPKDAQPSFTVQQIRDRAYHQGDDALTAACDRWLSDKPHLIDRCQLRRPANSALLRTFVGHTGQVNGALALSDGSLLSWSDDGTLRCWSVAGESLAVFQGHTGSVNGALELDDGCILSWSDDRTLRRWSADGAVLTVFQGHTGSVTGALELSDGSILSWAGNFGTDYTLRRWSTDGSVLTVFQGHTGSVTGALELSDNSILSWAGGFGTTDFILRRWRLDGQELAHFKGHTHSVTGVLVLPDSTILSWASGFGTTDFTLRRWGLDGQELARFEGHTWTVNGALVLTDDSVLSWSQDGTRRRWRLDGQELTRFEEHMGSILDVLRLPDGTLLARSWDHTLRRWGLDGQELARFEGHTDSVAGILVLTDGNVLSWSDDCTLRRWGLDGQELARFEGHTNSVTGALELGDGSILSWSGGHGFADYTLRRWREDDREVEGFQGHIKRVNGALGLADGSLLSWSQDGTLRRWGLDGQELARFEGHTWTVNGALVLTDGSVLSWSDDRTLRRWGLDGQELARFEGHTWAVNSAMILANGSVLSWSDDRTLRRWGLDGQELARFKGHTRGVGGALILSDNTILSWSGGIGLYSDHTLRRWGLDGQELACFKGHTHSVTGALALADGSIISWAGGFNSTDHTLWHWSSDGQEHVVFRGHKQSVTGTMMLSNGSLLSWSSDGTLRRWGLDGQEVAVFQGHTDDVNGALVMADGSLVSWSDDDTLRRWSLEGRELARLDEHLYRGDKVRIFAWAREQGFDANLLFAEADEPRVGGLRAFSRDNAVYLYDPADGATRAIFRADARITCLAASTDGRALLAGDTQGRVLILAVKGV